ncbi:MAG: hypothetical protein JXQ90_11665 [Cyclobacteriaceae bacterium]
MNRYTSIILIIMISSLSALGQSDIEMADNFRGEGKIYVVVAVVLTILAGVFLSLFKAEKRIKKLEKELEERK